MIKIFCDLCKKEIKGIIVFKMSRKNNVNGRWVLHKRCVKKWEKLYG